MRLTLGPVVAEFLEDWLRVPAGRHRGSPLRLVDDQVDQLCALYEFRFDSDAGVWVRVNNHVAIFGPKSSGKSPLAAGAAIAEIVGPTLPVGLDDDGFLVGGLNPDGWVTIGANSEDQAERTTWKPLRRMLLDAPELCEEFGVDVGKTRVEVAGTERRIEYFGATSGSAEGMKPSLFVAEETQHATSSNGGVAMLETMMENIDSTPGAAMLEVTNAPALGEGSFAERTYMRALAEAELPEEDRSVVLFHREPAVELESVKGDAVKDEVCAAIEYVYGQAVDPVVGWLTVESRWRALQKQETYSGRRKVLNQVLKSEEKFVNVVWWDSAAREGVGVPDGQFVVLGFDGSESEDATALVAVSCTDVPHVETVGVWKKPRDVDRGDYRIPKGEVKAALDKCRQRWKVEAIVCDPSWHWKSFVADLADGEGWGGVSPRWLGDRSDLKGWGLVCEVNMNTGHNVVDAVCSHLLGLLDSEPVAFTHDADGLLTSHATSMLRATRRGSLLTVAKAHEGESAQIDAGVAMMLGLWGAAQFPARGSGVDGGFDGSDGDAQADVNQRMRGSNGTGGSSVQDDINARMRGRA